MDDVVASLELPAGARAAGQARAYLRGLLPGWGLVPVQDDLLLLVTELVTNAVLHTGTAPVLRLRHEGGLRLRVEVEDGSPTLPRVHRYGTGSTTGRGLRLLDAIAAEWGADPRPPGKVLWFVLDGSAGPDLALRTG